MMEVIGWVLAIISIFVWGAIFKWFLLLENPQEKEVKKGRKEPQLFDLRADMVEQVKKQEKRIENAAAGVSAHQVQCQEVTKEAPA